MLSSITTSGGPRHARSAPDARRSGRVFSHPTNKAAKARNPTLDEIHEAWDAADDIYRFLPAVRGSLDAFLSAKDDRSRMQALAELVSYRAFDLWLLRLVASGQLTPTKPASPGARVVTIEPSEDRGGSVWISFPLPGQTWQFGQHLKNLVLLSRVQPLLDSIGKFDVPSIAETLSSFRTILEGESATATAVVAPLEAILDKNSRWIVELYLANLSGSPIAIDAAAELRVVDLSGKEYPEPCRRVVSETVGGESRRVIDAPTPLVVRAGDGVSAGFVTTKKQREMDYGDELRRAYEKGSGTCSLVLHISKVGLFRRQSLRTEAVPFHKGESTRG